jgi:hypothetical protein
VLGNWRETLTAFQKPLDGPSLPAVLAHLRTLGFKRLGLLIDSSKESDLPATVGGLPVACIVDASRDRPPAVSAHADVPRLSMAAAVSKKAADALVIANNDHFPLLMRAAEPLSRAGIVIVPGDPSAVVPDWVRLGSPQDLVWKWIGAEYPARSGLKGHYVEFGTFWGASFFRAYHFLKGWLAGDFFAFDSFEGLSKPTAQEIEFTANDFYEGAYACNVRSFETIADLVGMDRHRLKAIKGFYSETVVNRQARDYGLEMGSVSICTIDCDLFEPTLQVLEFVRPLLAQGSLIYFDDWRLCRASPHAGERAACLEWLRRHPEIELIELHRDHWQHQWFIYHSL